MPSGVSFSGIASGIDTKALIQSLVTLERRPIDLLQIKKQDQQSQLDAFKSLNSKLDEFDKKLKEFQRSGDILAYSSSLSQEGYFSITTSAKATPGNFDIGITQLAQAEIERSTNGYANADTVNFGGGTLSVTVGSTTTDVTIQAGKSSLLDIRDAINKSSAEVNASVVFDGTDYHLEVYGKDSGAANSVSLDASGLAGGTAPTSLTFSNVRAAQDATFTVNGQDYTSTDNVVEDAIQGVTLNLQRITDDGDVSLSISADHSATEDRIEEILNAYNEIVKFLNKETKVTVNGTETSTGPLQGEIAVRGLTRALSSALIRQVDSGGSLELDSLASIGARLQPDGTIKLDSDDFQEALASNEDDVNALFTDKGFGLVSGMRSQLKLYNDKIDGILSTRVDGISRTIKDLDQRIAASERRVSEFERTQVQKYAAFETLMGRLQTQGNALTSIGLFNR